MQPAERKRPGMRALFGSMALGLFASSSSGSKVVKGGIKTDGSCRALDADNNVISGLYVAGCAADLWSVPYYQGGSCNGFCLASGPLAGESAADDIA